MTTRAHLADGTSFDYDEETEAHPTHVNDQAVVRRQYVGPTPPRPKGVPGETREQQRDRLRAELRALEDDDDEDTAAAPAGGLFPPVG
jgi:hypothetical protein